VNPSNVDMNRRNDLFVSLLSAIAIDAGFDFDRMQLTQSVYLPVAHGEAEMEQTELRKAALDVVRGTRPIKMDVTAFPTDPEAVATLKGLHKKLADALTDGALVVEVKE